MALTVKIPLQFKPYTIIPTGVGAPKGLNENLLRIRNSLNAVVYYLNDPVVLELEDTDATHNLTLKWNEDETVDNRTLNFKVNAGDRTVDLSGNLTVETASILNQDLTTDADATLNDLSLTTPSNIYNLSHNSFADYTANKHVDHSGVSISGGGLISGGGDLTASRTLTLTTATIEGAVNHDNLVGFVSGEHFTQTSITTVGSGCVATDHGTAATDMLVNVCYGTGSPPTANTTTIGALYFKYTA